MLFLTVREQAVSVRGVFRFFRACSDVYMQNFWSEPIIHLPQDARSLARAMEICQYLMRQEGYVEGTTVVVALGSGVHEVVGSWKASWDPSWKTTEKTLSVPFDNLSFVGKGEGETIVDGCFVVENGRTVSFEGLAVTNLRPADRIFSRGGHGLIASGAGTKIFLKNVTLENCLFQGLYVGDGAKFDATGCHVPLASYLGQPSVLSGPKWS